MSDNPIFKLDGKKIQIHFSQRLVNWINKTQPDRNFYSMGGPTCLSVMSELSDTHPWEDGRHSIMAKKYPMPDFKPPVNIFWETPGAKVRNLIFEAVEYILARHSEKDIYLYTLRGQLIYQDTDRVTSQWQYLAHLE